MADVEGVAKPKREAKLQVGKDIPTNGEIKRLIAAAGEGRERALLLTLALTGLRASEARGLRWADVDLKASELHVRQRADRWNVIGQLKSDTSARTIPFSAELSMALKTWKLACPKGDARLWCSRRAPVSIEHHANMLRGLWPVMKTARRGRQEWRAEIRAACLPALVRVVVLQQQGEGRAATAGQ